MASYARLPAAPPPRDAAAETELNQAALKYAQLSQPGIGLSPEGAAFKQAVALGFVPDSADGYRLFIGWIVPPAGEVLAAGLVDWYAFKLRYVSRIAAANIPAQLTGSSQAVRDAVARMYEGEGIPAGDLGETVTIGGESNRVTIPKSWLVGPVQVDANGRSTARYRSNGVGAIVELSWGGSAPVIESRVLDLIDKNDPVRYANGDNRIEPIAWRVRTLNRMTGALLRQTGVSRWNGGLYPTSILNLQDRTNGSLGITSTWQSALSSDLAAGLAAAPAGNTAPPAEFGLGEHGARDPVQSDGTPAVADPVRPIGPTDLDLPQPSAGPTGATGGLPSLAPAPGGPAAGSAPVGDSGAIAERFGVPTWLLAVGAILAGIALVQLFKGKG